MVTLMGKKSVLKNFLYNSIYQILIIITPIITTPYISRVLKADGIGEYTSTYGIAYFFYIFALFGMNNYGSRAIAYVRDDKKNLNKTFWSIWIMQLFVGIISLIIYLSMFVFLDVLKNKYFYILQMPVVISGLLDISWLYMGMEDFKKTVSRNIIFKIIGIAFIFLLVKDYNDLPLYILINSMSTLLGIISMWIFIKEYVGNFEFDSSIISKNFKKAILILIPQLAVQVYTGLDRTIIKLLSDSYQAGMYDQSQKISRIALGLVTSISLVMMPKIANMFSNKDNKLIKRYLNISTNYTMIISVLLTSGIIATSRKFVPIFFGPGYEEVKLYMSISSVIIIFISVGGVFANQFALPTGKNKEYIIPLLNAGVINIILNLILDPIYGGFGGVISIIITEGITCFLRIYLVRKYIQVKDILKGTSIYLIAGTISAIGTILIGNFLKQNIISLGIEVIVCTSIYLIILWIKSEFFKENILEILNKFNSKLRKVN